MFCGTISFSHMEDDPSSPSTPRSSKKKHNKNPYSSQGLDKFSMVLEELEARRQKIIATTGSQGVALIRFMYDNSQDWIPIVVIPKEAKGETKAIRLLPPEVQERRQEEAKVDEDEKKKKKKKKEVKKSLSWSKREEWLRWKGAYYWLMVVVVMLLCLVVFGRVFAICCTSISWYLLPTIKDLSGGIERRGEKRKEYGRRLSDKRLGRNLVVQTCSQASKKSKRNEGGLQDLASPRTQGNVKKG